MTNEELVAEIRAGRNVKENKSLLWQQNRGYVAKKAHRYRFYAEFDDLMQEGYIALCDDAVEKYNPDAGVLFITFASYCLDTAMSRYISTQNVIRLPVIEDARIRKYNKAVNGIRLSTGREPTRDEIKTILGVDDKELNKIEKNICMRSVASLDKVQIEGEEDCTLNEVLPDDNDDLEQVEESIYIKALKDTIWKAVDDLPDEQSAVIHERYEHDKDLKEIDGMTWGRAAFLEQTALRFLRSGKTGRTLRPFYDIYNGAVKGNGVGTFRRTSTSSTERIAIALAEPEEVEP